MSEKVIVDVSGSVLTLTLHRPDRRNALDLEMYDALTVGLQRAAADPAVRVVLVRGDGDAFCGGNDLADFMKAPPTGDDSPVLRFLQAVATFPKPLVAAVQGPAIGIGTTLLLHCDLVYAADDATFAMPFVQLALVPEAGSSLLVPGLVGHRKATELLVLGDRFPAADAERYGIVNAVVARDALDDTARRAAERLAALPPEAVQATKALLKEPVRPALERAMAAEVEAFLQRLASPEAAEAMTAFFEKRAPRFG